MGFLGLMIIIYGFYSIQKTHQAAQRILSTEQVENPLNMDWNDGDIRTAYKQNIWLKNQLALSRETVMSLGINLKDSIIQIQLNGLALIQSPIYHYQPENFLSEMPAPVYSAFFGTPASILHEYSNIPKRPIRKKKVIPGAETVEEKVDTISPAFHWEFMMDHQLKVVINTLKSVNDSVLEAPNLAKDKFRYHFIQAFENQDSLGYYPVLFLWIKETETKALYRALPEHAKVILRN